MLLEQSELVTDPDSFKLHDYQYLYARLELLSVGSPSTMGTWFACVSLGSISDPAGPVKMRTTGFELPMIRSFQASYELYRKLYDRSVREYGYPEFLLLWLREQSKIQVVFPVRDGRTRRFAVRMDNIVVEGRVPDDVDVLRTYFGAVLVASD